jgi:hypothetical protein
VDYECGLFGRIIGKELSYEQGSRSQEFDSEREKSNCIQKLGRIKN